VTKTQINWDVLNENGAELVIKNQFFNSKELATKAFKRDSHKGLKRELFYKCNNKQEFEKLRIPKHNLKVD